MATERQIAANRRNAHRSTGPKSRVGKKRASRNAYRYGLSIEYGLDEDAEALEQLARKIADDGHPFNLELARTLGRAQLDLDRIRALTVGIMNRVAILGTLEPAPLFRSVNAEIRWLKKQPLDRPLRWPEPVDPNGPMPIDKQERAAEAVRRLAPELRKLYRYERRALARRDRALREILRIRSAECDD